MAALIIYGIIAAAALASLGGFVFHERTVGADGERKKNAPIIAAAQKRADDAELANITLKASIAGVQKKCDEAAQLFRDQHALDLAQQAQTKRENDALRAKQAADKSTIAKLDARAATPSTGTPAQTCAEAETILNDLVKWRTQ